MQQLAVDLRVVAKIPDQLSLIDAASLPIGTLTGWEAPFRDQPALPPGARSSSKPDDADEILKMIRAPSRSPSVLKSRPEPRLSGTSRIGKRNCSPTRTCCARLSAAVLAPLINRLLLDPLGTEPVLITACERRAVIEAWTEANITRPGACKTAQLCACRSVLAIHASKTRYPAKTSNAGQSA